MAERNSRTVFTAEEYQRIKALVKEKEQADSRRQKSIRNQIRRIGLYWSEISNGEAYTVANLEKLREMGVIKVDA